MGMLRVNMQGNVENGGRLALCVMQNMLQCPLCVFVNSWLLQHAITEDTTRRVSRSREEFLNEFGIFQLV